MNYDDDNLKGKKLVDYNNNTNKEQNKKNEYKT